MVAVAPLLAAIGLLPSARAFLAPSPRAASISALRAESDGCTRRELLSASAAGAAASLLARPSSAEAAATATAPSKASAIVSQTLCDPSVSTWTRRYDDGSLRTVHLLGTAHISASSAELAGKMVRDLRPDVVFVELDAKRVARAIPGGIKGAGGGSADANAANSSGAGESRSTLALGNDGAPDRTESTSVAKGSITSTPSQASESLKSNPFDVESKLVNAGSKVVGDSVKGMYGKLESEGFKAGDEFARSVREGLMVGSTIVLGDQDVEVTLRRLTRALTKTDLRKLLGADSEINASMEELLPEDMKAALKSPKSGGGISSANGNTMSVSEGVSIDKAEFQTFVETMKAKDNVKKIMQVLKSSAPEIYEAMVGERDRYMARGLDELGDTLSGKAVAETVAVCGMAHVDGIETYLADRGWKELSYPCPVVR
ncbi:hypothetical protein ACHAXT_005472 [Thalassiosira profunda]